MKVKQLTEELKKCNPEDLVVFMGDKRNCLYSAVKSIDNGFAFNSEDGEVYEPATIKEEKIEGSFESCVILD